MVNLLDFHFCCAESLAICLSEETTPNKKEKNFWLLAVVELVLKNFLPDRCTRQAHELSIKTTWTKDCQQIGLFVVNNRDLIGVGGKSGGNCSRLPLLNLSGILSEGKMSTKCFFLFFDKISEPLFSPLQLLSFSYARKKFFLIQSLTYTYKNQRESVIQTWKEKRKFRISQCIVFGRAWAISVVTCFDMAWNKQFKI